MATVYTKINAKEFRRWQVSECSKILCSKVSDKWNMRTGALGLPLSILWNNCIKKQNLWKKSMENKVIEALGHLSYFYFS